MDTLLTILLFVGAAILSAFFKKKEAESESEPEDSGSWRPDSSPPAEGRQPGSPQPPRRLSWEDELRRLLEGETSPQPAAPPPPLLIPTTPPTQAPPPPVPSTYSAPTVSTRRTKTSRESKRPPLSVPVLQQSQMAYSRASQMRERTEEKLKKVTEGIQTHGLKPFAPRENPEVRNALNWMQSPQSLRSAMIASIILGPPKSMEISS